MSKFIQLYETLCPDDPIMRDDPRRPAIIAEMRHVCTAKTEADAVKAVEYSRRAADQAMVRLAYEGAADLYGHALHALEDVDDLERRR